MVRIRRPPSLLLLLLAVSGVIVNGEIEPSYLECGILTLCIVHKSCFGDAAATKDEKGWTIMKNSDNTLESFKKSAPEGYRTHDCDRFITMRPDLGGDSITVKVRDKKVISYTQGIRIWLANGNAKSTDPRIVCDLSSARTEGETISRIGIHEQKAKTPNTDCHFVIKASERNSDIRQVLQDISNNKFEISDADKANNDLVRYPIDEVNLPRLKMLCEGTQVKQVTPSLTSVADDELTNHTVTDLVPPNPKYCTTLENDKKCSKLLDNDRVVCPVGYTMKHRVGHGDDTWTFVNKGLKCVKGYLTHHDNPSTKVDLQDGIKCSRKKCSTCDDPGLKRSNEPHFETPEFDEAEKGDTCRVLKCPNLKYMIVTLQGVKDPILHKSNTLSCSGGNKVMAEKNWEATDPFTGVKTGELVNALCADDVYCTKMHPLVKQPCKKEDNQCYEAFITDSYENTTPCPDNFTLVYTAKGSGNKFYLSDFECKQENGVWHAKDLRKARVEILAHGSLVCERNKKDPMVAHQMEPFVGSLPFWVFLGGIGMVVIAIIVVGGFLVVRSKKEKERKKKAMASVSQTFKEPPKYKKGDRKSERERKNRQVSVINSVTGNTDSGPNSQSGGSTAGSVPIAPPSKLYSPGQGFAKPDKGCAVLDLTTGKSKNLQWTNHTGDGPPTQRQPSNVPFLEPSNSILQKPSNDWAAANSDIQSAIKFAPEEQEAIKAAGRANAKKKKEKSRQKSIEYDLGGPRPADFQDSKRANKRVPDVSESRGSVDDSTLKQ